MRNFLITLGVLLTAVMMVASLDSCGSKKNDSTGTTVSAGTAAGAASDAVSNATLALSSVVAPAAAPSFGGNDLPGAISSFYDGLAGFRARAASLATGLTLTLNCTVSGQNIVYANTGILSMNFVNCIDSVTRLGVAAQHYQNGLFLWSTTTDTTTGKLNSITAKWGDSTTNFTNRFTRTSDGRVISDNVGYQTLQATVLSSATCTKGTTPVEVPTSMIFGLDGQDRNKLDVNMDGNYDFDTSWQASNFQLGINVNDFIVSTCVPSTGSIQESGLFAVTGNLNPLASHSMDISSTNPLTLTFAPVTGGQDLTVNGTFTATTPCFTGTLTLATSTPIYVVPLVDCPLGGQVDVTGDVTGSVVFTGTGGVSVTDGSGTRNYGSCKGVNACI